MRIRKDFRFSEEVVAELDKQSNATQYIEELILNRGPKEAPPWKNIEWKIETLSEEIRYLVSGSDKKITIDTVEKITASPDGEEELVMPACCSKSAPCKHWQFDGLSDTWTNSLSGETKDA